MRKKKVSKRRASRQFKRHANKSKRVNYAPPVQNGGIRLQEVENGKKMACLLL